MGMLYLLAHLPGDKPSLDPDPPHRYILTAAIEYFLAPFAPNFLGKVPPDFIKSGLQFVGYLVQSPKIVGIEVLRAPRLGKTVEIIREADFRV